MKPDDIPFIVKNIETEMPLHTNVSAEIPYSFKKMPKNIMEESHKVDNKFLNNHLAEIEEATHCNLIDKKPFIKQQVTHHGNSDILNHDNFFHADLSTGVPMGTDSFKHYPFIMNPSRFAVSGVAGSELNTGDTGTGGQTNDRVFIMRTTSDGNITDLYDQMAYRWASGACNQRLGCYDDVSTVPTNLLVETGSDASDASYTYHAVTEFGLVTAEVWLAVNRSVGGTSGEGSTTSQYKDGLGFGAMPDPTGSSWTTGTQTRTVKMGHS